VHHDDVAREGERGDVRRAQQQRRAAPGGERREHELLPRVPGAVHEPRARPDDLVVAQRGQPRGHLARPALDAAELGACCGTRVDEEGTADH
jgi:hypothetical protein